MAFNVATTSNYYTISMDSGTASTVTWPIIWSKVMPSDPEPAPSNETWWQTKRLKEVTCG